MVGAAKWQWVQKKVPWQMETRTKTCGPYPGGVILTHTQMLRNPSHSVRRPDSMPRPPPGVSPPFVGKPFDPCSWFRKGHLQSQKKTLGESTPGNLKNRCPQHPRQKNSKTSPVSNLRSPFRTLPKTTPTATPRHEAVQVDGLVGSPRGIPWPGEERLPVFFFFCALKRETMNPGRNGERSS